MQVPAGTVLTNKNFSNPLTGLTVSGDSVIVYTASAAGKMPSAFLCALQTSVAGWSDAVNSGTSALPAALTSGVNALALPHMDNNWYKRSAPTSGTAAQLRAALNDPRNWLGSNKVGQAAEWPTRFSVLSPASRQHVKSQPPPTPLPTTAPTTGALGPAYTLSSHTHCGGTNINSLDGGKTPYG